MSDITAVTANYSGRSAPCVTMFVPASMSVPTPRHRLDHDPWRAPAGRRAGALLGLHHVSPAAARGDGGHPRAPRLAGRDADRRRQVDLLPGAGARHRGAGPGRVAAHLADEGPGGHARRQRRGGGLLQQRAVVRAEGRACSTTCASRPHQAALRVAGAARRRRRRRVSCGASRPAAPRSASSPSTRRTASASGATTSGPSTASSPACATSSPASACTPSRPPPPPACGATSPTSWRCDAPLELVGSFDRPNLTYRVLPRATLKAQILDVLERHTGQAGIIYCSSRKDVDQLAAWLQGQGLRAVPYHAGLSDEERHRHQDAFLDEQADVVVATVAFGMGIDRSDVRYVDPRRGAAVARALPAGVGPRRPRRPRSRVRADRLGRRLPEVAPDARAQRRAERPAAPAAARHRALRRRASAAATSTCSRTSASATPRTTAAPATSASASSSRSPIR